ncbi:hypothetical protein EVAR_87199_1 [Eumeta japonica]|uniref:Uncharacterized protein n=1 Tax=Eumeta variegata TaxID=151549 RepID=A0A4C1VU48_EUMVA|nr:hypothetical protein EVAR_87199_1 [Eumeta japonica]
MSQTLNRFNRKVLESITAKIVREANLKIPEYLPNRVNFPWYYPSGPPKSWNQLGGHDLHDPPLDPPLGIPVYI